VRLRYLCHQIVVPLTGHLYVSGRTQQDGIDQVVIEIHIEPGLAEFVQGGDRRPAAHEPRLKIGHRRGAERSARPGQVGVVADDMRARIPVGLGVDEQHLFSDIGGQRVLAGERTGRPVENDMGRRERPHDIELPLHRSKRRVEETVGAVVILRKIEVLFPDIIDPVGCQWSQVSNYSTYQDELNIASVGRKNLTLIFCSMQYCENP